MYRAPLREIRFVMHELLGDDALVKAYADIDYSGDLADNIVEEAAKFAENVLEPLNRTGDEQGAAWSASGVTTPKGFKEAYAAYVEAGWTQMPVSAELGGQGMPHTVTLAVEELMFASNMAFFLGTSLAHGAVGAIAASATPEQVAMFTPKMVSGEWTGTMNLTEPQAGSDLALMRTRAVPDGRSLPHLRPEDLHHLRRARLHVEHHPHGARAHRRRAARASRASRCSSCRSSWSDAMVRAGRAQRRALPVDRTQARHPCEPHLRHGLRREGRARSVISSASRTAASNTCSS
jgi:hypothetical protein